jgi:O-antigen ligase
MSAKMGLPGRIEMDSLLWYGYAGMFFFVPVAISPLAICGVFVIAVWILSGSFLKDMRTWIKSDMKIPMLLLIFLPWMGLIYTPVPREGLNVAFKTHYWLFAIALMPLLRSRLEATGRGKEGRPDLILKMFLSGLALNCTIAIIQFLGLAPLTRGLPTGLLGGGAAHIPFSLLLTTGILISSFYFLKASSAKVRIIYACLMAQFFVTMTFIGARSGYLALLALSPLIVYNVLGRRHLFGIVTGCLIIMALLFASPIVEKRVSMIKQDLIQYKQGNVNTSVGLRLHMWNIAYREIKKNPLTGIGTAGFLSAWEKYKKDPSLPSFIHGNPHNSFLYMMVSFGILGLISFCWLLFIMLRNGWRERGSPLGFAVLAFMMVFTIGSFVDTPLLSVAAANALSLFAGIAGAIDKV